MTLKIAGSSSQYHTHDTDVDGLLFQCPVTCIDKVFKVRVCMKKTSLCDGVTECQGGEDEDKETCEKYKVCATCHVIMGMGTGLEEGGSPKTFYDTGTDKGRFIYYWRGEDGSKN